MRTGREHARSVLLPLLAVVLGWAILAPMTLSSTLSGPSLILSTVALAALAVGGTVIAARVAVLSLGRRPARVPVRRTRTPSPLPRAADPDRPRSSRPRAPGCTLS